MSAPDDEVIIERWWGNRSGDAIVVRLTTFRGQRLIDVRKWYTDPKGILLPGKGFAANVKHIPRLIKALTKALSKVDAPRAVDDAPSEHEERTP